MRSHKVKALVTNSGAFQGREELAKGSELQKQWMESGAVVLQ